MCLLFMVEWVAPNPTEQCKQTRCKFEISNKSINYFHSRLLEEDPKFMKFYIRFNGSQFFNATSDTFQPTKWYWTYNSSRGMYPYLYWNVDFGVLSFGLLEAKTLQEHPFVFMDVQAQQEDENCVVTYGTRDTTKGIACALETLLQDFENPKYQNSYYCFLAEKPGVRDSMQYIAAMYLLYPVDFINYNCCVTGFHYTTGVPYNNCFENQIRKWPQCTILPYILGLCFFLYFPIVVLNIGDTLSRNISVIPQEYEMIGVENEIPSGINSGDDGWVYLNEYSPYSILDCMSHLWCGLDQTHPIAVSRFKRFLFLILAPTPVFIQLLLYNYNWEHGMVDKFVQHGTPMGFLSLLADKSVRDLYFVPAFGGGLNILLAYGILGLVIVVLPYNLKQILEDGISLSSNTIRSPLCLGIWEMHDLSMIQTSSDPGYGRCSEICISGIYLIFNPRFWVRAVFIQYNRLCSFFDTFCPERTIFGLLKVIIIPFYVLFCVIELVLCLVWFGVPFFRFIYFLLRGVSSSLFTLRLNSEGRPNRCSLFIRNPVVFGLITVILFSASSFFTYTYCLIFIQSFDFISQVLVFCFVAVIVYPAVSFGYLFFFVMLIYYIFHMMRGFGDVYLLLLSEAVEVSRNLDGEINHTSTFDNTLQVSNIRAHGITRVTIEGEQVCCLAQNFFQSITDEGRRKPRVRLRINMYGIPKRLFNLLISKHKPVNQQVLKIVFQLVLITLLLAITMSIAGGFVTGPTSEISDVMHVIFIVTIGALPRVLEVAVTTSNESVKREIELRRLEQTIMRYWEREEIEIINDLHVNESSESFTCQDMFSDMTK